MIREMKLFYPRHGLGEDDPGSPLSSILKSFKKMTGSFSWTGPVVNATGKGTGL